MIPEESDMIDPTPPDRCDQCQQRNCTVAVELAHLIRRAATIAEESGNEEMAMFLRLGLAFATREKR